MARIAPIEFFKQVKSEVKKISWPSRAETTQGTVAVFVMVLLASLFLFFADQVLSWAIRLILGLA